mmetsp:Transcript_46423/g.116376  ORF Transcript_46423/g.116376 Transcript_46423/m.116376 type:complete len:268 (-) Transcript_46423:144-947(-)
MTSLRNLSAGCSSVFTKSLDRSGAVGVLPNESRYSSGSTECPGTVSSWAFLVRSSSNRSLSSLLKTPSTPRSLSATHICSMVLIHRCTLTLISASVTSRTLLDAHCTCSSSSALSSIFTSTCGPGPASHTIPGRSTPVAGMHAITSAPILMGCEEPLPFGGRFCGGILTECPAGILVEGVRPSRRDALRDSSSSPLHPYLFAILMSVSPCSLVYVPPSGNDMRSPRRWSCAPDPELPSKSIMSAPTPPPPPRASSCPPARIETSLWG